MEILLPSYFKNFFSAFTSSKLSYINAVSAPEIKLFPTPRSNSAAKKPKNVYETEKSENPKNARTHPKIKVFFLPIKSAA